MIEFKRADDRDHYHDSTVTPKPDAVMAPLQEATRAHDLELCTSCRASATNARNDPICIARASSDDIIKVTYNGGSRAKAAASDRHAERLTLRRLKATLPRSSCRFNGG
jgi:hypothetical protein